MHVLMLPSWYPSSYNELSGAFFKEQAQALVNNGHQVGVIAIPAVGIRNILTHKKLDFTFSYSNENGLNTYRQQFLDVKVEFLTNRMKQKIFIKLLDRYLENHGCPQVLHLQSYMLGELALYAKKHHGIPFVITEHSSGFLRDTMSAQQQRLAQMVFDEADAHVAVSDPLAKVLSKHYGHEFTEIGNIVDVDFFTINNRQSKAECFRFINVAFLDKNKNQAMLIRAFHQAFGDNKSVELLIVGDGVEYQQLSALIDELAVADQVSLYGKANKSTVKKLLQNSHAFVLSSHFETFGVVIIEAMACGLPVVSTKCGGVQGIITSAEYGLLADVNEASLSSRLQLMYRHYDKYESNSIRQHIKKHFSGPAVSRQLTDIYQRVVT